MTDASDYTIPVHGERRDLHHVAIEVRQDLIADDKGQRAWGRQHSCRHAEVVLVLKPYDRDSQASWLDQFAVAHAALPTYPFPRFSSLALFGRRLSPRLDNPNGDDADRTADNAEQPHQPSGLGLQPRRVGLQRAQRLADFAPRAGRGHLANACPAHNQRTGKHIRQIIAAWSLDFERRGAGGGDFANRHRLARQ